MRNNIYHNKILTEKHLDKNFFSPTNNVNPKIIVDINKLLNRVKIDQKIEKKKKFIFFCLGLLLLGTMGSFVSIIN